MGTGIGINCERCNHQLNYDDGFELKEDGYNFNLCKECATIVAFDRKLKDTPNPSE